MGGTGASHTFKERNPKLTMYTKEQVEKIIRKLFTDNFLAVEPLIKEDAWNEDGYIESNGFELTAAFDKWFNDNVK